MTTGPTTDLKLPATMGESLKSFGQNLATFIALALLTVYFAAVGLIFTLNNLLLKGWVAGMECMGRRRIIMDRENDEPYLERYYLFLRDRGTFPFNIFLHKFLKSDPDNLHDHPWGYTTFVIWGGYWEYTENAEGKRVKKWCGVGYFANRPALWKHRLELDPAHPTCWTLFIPHKRTREWGFYKPAEGGIEKEEWVHADKYFLEKAKEKAL